MMATSSIFYNVRIDTPEKAEAFVTALEESEKEYTVSNRKRHGLTTDPARIRELVRANRKNGENG